MGDSAALPAHILQSAVLVIAFFVIGNDRSLFTAGLACLDS